MDHHGTTHQYQQSRSEEDSDEKNNSAFKTKEATANYPCREEKTGHQ